MTGLNEKETQFLEAYEKWSDAIFRHCLFRIFNREAALDITQTAFTKTWEYLVSGREIENIRAFLYRTAQNLIVDHSRKKKSYSLDEMREKGFDPKLTERISPEDQTELKNILRIAAGLDLPYQEVIIMRFVDGLQPKEIAEVLNESENSISVRIHRGINKIKEVIAKGSHKG